MYCTHGNVVKGKGLNKLLELGEGRKDRPSKIKAQSTENCLKNHFKSNLLFSTFRGGDGELFSSNNSLERKCPLQKASGNCLSIYIIQNPFYGLQIF